MPFCQSCYNPMPPDQEGRNPHKRDCPNQSPEQMLAVIKMQMGEAAWDKNQWVKASNNRVMWQAKFHTLRLENNGLRRRLRKQEAPAKGPEPRGYNPNSLTPEQIGDGWRLLAYDEAVVPKDGQIWERASGQWMDSILQGYHKDFSSAYRTRTPLPK